MANSTPMTDKEFEERALTAYSYDAPLVTEARRARESEKALLEKIAMVKHDLDESIGILLPLCLSLPDER